MLNSTSNNYINEIYTVLQQKSGSMKSAQHLDILKQVSIFSFDYRDFIYKIISNSSLKIKHESGESYIRDIDKEEQDRTNLSKRRKNEIKYDIYDTTVLPHELGHAVDFWFGRYLSLSTTVILENDKTLDDIFTEEFDSKYKQLYQMIINEYKEILNTKISNDAYDVIFTNLPKFQKLDSIPIDLKDKRTMSRRRKLQEELYENKFVEYYYQLSTKHYFKPLNDKYSIISDALSSKYNIYYSLLESHEFEYYNINQRRIVYEFFANCFAAKVTNNLQQLNNLKLFLPKSYNAFEQLFNIFYTRIQNNKRFTDLKLKKGNN